MEQASSDVIIPHFLVFHFVSPPPLLPLSVSFWSAQVPLQMVHVISPCKSARSEERRVGKEGRSRWWPYQ